MIMITPLPGVTTTKPGRRHVPVPGHRGGRRRRATATPCRWAAAATSSSSGRGRRCCAASTATRSATGQTYWSRFPGMYFAGDGAKRDDEGYFWLLGRVDDVMNVVGPPHLDHRGRDRRWSTTRRSPRPRSSARRTRSRGQAIFAFVILRPGNEPTRRARRRSCASTSPRSSARSPSPSTCCSRRTCPRRARARSCAGCCATSPRAAAGRHDHARRRDASSRRSATTPARPRRTEGVPFDFLKRSKPTSRTATGSGGSRPRARPLRAAAGREGQGVGRQAGRRPERVEHARRPSRGVPFIGLTEDWRLRGRMDISGRLSDALNKREAIPITDVSWGRPTARPPLEEAPGPAQRRPLRPDPGHGRRGQPAAAHRHGADRAQGPQGRLRRGARGAAVPRRRHGLPAPGLGAGPPARPVVGDVRGDRGRGRAPRRHRGRPTQRST